MTTIRRSGGTYAMAVQRVSGSPYSSASVGSAYLSANTNTGIASNVAFAFDDIDLPAGIYIRSASLVFFIDNSGSNATGSKFTLSAHKVPSVPPLRASGSGTDDINTRLAATTTEQIVVNHPAAYTTDEFKQSFDVTDIVQELVEQGSWDSTDNNIVFLLNSATDTNEDLLILGPGHTRQDLRPELYVNFGNVADDAFDFDLLIGFDSHGVIAGQAGYQIFDIAITYPGWNITVEETYAGMVDEEFITGDLFGSGDQRRGYSPGGLVQDYMEEKYGERVQVYRGEYALGGTTLAQWWFWKFMQQATNPATDPGLPTSQAPYVYDAGQSHGPGYGPWAAIDNQLQNPRSASRRQFFWFSALGNDWRNVGNQTGEDRLIEPRSSRYDDLADELIPLTADIFTHILQTWEDNDVEGWILLPSYQNFIVMCPDPALGWYTYPPNGGPSSDEPFERLVWSSSGFGIGFANADWEGGMNTLRPGGPTNPSDPDDPWILSNSAHMRAAIWRQIEQNGAFNNTNALPWNAQWASAQLWASPLSNPGDGTWHRSFGGTVSRTIDVWKEAMENVTDISVNSIMVGYTNLVIEQAIALVVADHPEWASRFMYYPNGQVHGIDEDNSADPGSQWAQPPRAGTVRTDGLHPTKERTDIWVRAFVDWLDTQIPFLPGYVPTTASNFFF